MATTDDNGPSDDRIVEILNNSFDKKKNPSVETLKGRIVGHDRANGTISMTFRAGDELCNGKPGIRAQVQGGFGAAMIDAICAHAVVFFSRFKTTVASLEQKVSWIRPIPPNVTLYATCKVIKMGRTLAFLEATLSKGDQGREEDILVRGSQTSSLVALPPKKPKKSKL